MQENCLPHDYKLEIQVQDSQRCSNNLLRERYILHKTWLEKARAGCTLVHRINYELFKVMIAILPKCPMDNLSPWR